MHQIDRRALIASALCLPLALASAQSPTWPSRAVKIIVPVAAGTATDLTARIFAEHLAVRWGQPVVTENRPGADGLLAIGSFVSARDDHALLFSFSTAVSLNPLVHAKLPYDPDVDLTPITTTTEVLFAIAVHTGVPAATMLDLAAHVRANPGKLNWAAAPGLPRFVLERYRREQGLDMAYVSYAQTGSAVQDLGEGRLQVMIASVGTLMPVVEAGKARLVLIASSDRSPLTPNVPSARETNLADLVVPAVGCVYGWRQMPVAVRDRIAADIDTIAQNGEVARRFAAIGQLVRRSAPAELQRFLAEQRPQLRPIADAMKAEQK